MPNQTGPANSESVKRLWGKEADEHVRYGKGFHWVESPLVMCYIQEQVTGNPNVDWLAYSYQKYLQGRNAQMARVLSVGCGGGALERGLCHLGFNGRIDAYDFSEGAIEHARAMAAQEKLENIQYFICDLNQAEFPAETYDVVFSSSAFHHISNLEHLLDQVRLGLVEHGLLIINEYVGPFQLQWTPQQTKIIDELLHLLPKKYRKRVSAPDLFKDAFLGPSPIREMDANDPSESIRSDEIVPLLRARFRIRELKSYGGTLLHMLLQDIVGNFNPNDPLDAGYLQLLIYIEKLLIRERVLESDFTYLVAEKTFEHSAETAEPEHPIDLASELKGRDIRIQSMNERIWQWADYARSLENQILEWSKHAQNLRLEIERLNAGGRPR